MVSQRIGRERMIPLQNKTVGMFSSIVNLIAVIGFAVSMLFGFDFGSYFSSMFIAFSFVSMMACYACFASAERKAAGFSAVGFSAMYAAIILLVYFAQLTTVRTGSLSSQAASLLDFQQFGLMFNYDLLGYGLMALATFFAGLTFPPNSRPDRVLKALLTIHGVFFFSCLIFPMLGVFRPGGPDWIGVAVLEFWCVYFAPISILSCRHFAKL